MGNPYFRWGGELAKPNPKTIFLIKNIYLFKTCFISKSSNRIVNLTSEAWIFWHLFFIVGIRAVIAFEGSLIHLHCTLLSKAGNMICIWHMSSFHLLSCLHSLCDVMLFIWGRCCFSVWILREGRWVLVGRVDLKDSIIFHLMLSSVIYTLKQIHFLKVCLLIISKMYETKIKSVK